MAVPSVDRSAVNEGDTVTLDGSKSTDSGNGNHLLYHWEQVPIGGPTVELSNPDIATPYFTAPKGLSDTTKLTFKLVVTDNLDVNDKAYHGNPASTPENVDVTTCAPKKDPVLTWWYTGPVPFPKAVLNVPDTTTGTCDYSQVDVRDTYLGSRYNPVSLAERHLFIIYTDEDGKQTVFRGGPSKDCHPDCGDLVSTITGDYPTGDTDWDPHASSRTVLKGVAAHDADKCFSAVSNSIDEKGIPYKALGPNSNTFAKTLLSKCGLWPPSAFSYGASSLLPPYIQFGSMQVPGWGMPDLVKCYYSKTDDKCE